MNTFTSLLTDALPGLATQQPQQLEQLVQYLELLQRWNKAYNLTAVRDADEMVVRLILDSLSIADYIAGERVLDVGTGAGLPGLILAVTQPQRQFTLLDSNGKKTRFLEHVVDELKLQNVQVIQTRIERWQPPHCFNTIVTRAFAKTAIILELTQHACCSTGRFLAMKGVYPGQELLEIPKKFTVCAVHHLQVPKLVAERHLVHVEFKKEEK